MNVSFIGVNFNWKKEARAKIYTHEFSHLFGLKDEYDTTLSERVGELDNIMRNWDASPGRLYPHQIRGIISPICP